ncbi:hypothetical protein ACFY91_24470 [Streptomyces albogriseolus]|uniref:hypothetical protein n=1 Tax=Streptomyces albogriseolus TaxID=1887 RepID=UPI0036E6BF54
MSDVLDTFWAAIAEQLQELRTAKNADDVLSTLASGHGLDRGFFAGSGGDDTVSDALYAAGWELVWAESSIYYTMRAPDGSMITYIEGDIYRGDRHGNCPGQTGRPAN